MSTNRYITSSLCPIITQHQIKSIDTVKVQEQTIITEQLPHIFNISQSLTSNEWNYLQISITFKPHSEHSQLRLSYIESFPVEEPYFIFFTPSRTKFIIKAPASNKYTKICGVIHIIQETNIITKFQYVKVLYHRSHHHASWKRKNIKFY
jgi:hypothetical protein